MIKCNKGLTLVELIVSLAILGIIMAPLASFFVNTININQKSKDRLKANNVAQKYMEEAKFESLDQLGKNEESKTIEIDDGDYKIIKMIERVDEYKVKRGKPFNTECQIKIGIEDEIDKKINFYQENSTSLKNWISNIDRNNKIKVTLKKNPEKTVDVCFEYIQKNISYNNIRLIEDKESKEKYLNIEIVASGKSNIDFEVSGLNDIKTNVYIIKSQRSTNEIEIMNRKGKVYVYKNIYDNSVRKKENNWVYKITIIVKKNGKELTKLTGLKNID